MHGYNNIHNALISKNIDVFLDVLAKLEAIESNPVGSGGDQ